MARFQPRKFTEILARMTARVVSRTTLTDTVIGGFVNTILAAVARELDDLGFQLVNLQRIWDIDTATGEDLDERAKDVNPDEITRQTASKATVSVTFGRTATVGAASVAAGTTVKVPGGGAQFVTSAAATFNDGDAVSSAVTATATVAGAAGNVDAGAITQMSAVSGVNTVTNAAAATGGQDGETDAELRARIKAYLRSLPRGTVQALTYAALSAALDGFGRVVTVQVVELTAPDLGTVLVYCDDGNGTIEQTDTLTATETVLTATGGEKRAFLANVPVRLGSPVDITRNAAPLVEDTDYTLNYATGQITLDPTLYPAGLTAGDVLAATAYTWYTALLGEVQRILDGDPAESAAYPGYRAAGTYVRAVPPTVYQQIVAAAVVTEDGYDRATVLASVSDAIMRYINGLGIGGDVVFTELVHVTQAVPGVYDVTFTAPTVNQTMGDGELARVTSANVSLT